MQRMDATTCLKSLLLAISQYRNSRSATNASQLKTQIDDLSGVKCGRLLVSGQVLPSECLSGLVELVGDPNTCPALTGTIISLLAQLAAADNERREALHSRYNLTGTLASVIHCNSATPREPVVLQCLQVLQKLTYSMRIPHCTPYMDELIAFLIQHVQSPNEDITMPCLGVLANLCRSNLFVQTHVKSLLFHAKNIHQTFQLIFNIIVNGDGTLTCKYAVDLLVDLLKNPKIADYLTRYEHFSLCLSQVLGLLQGKDPDSAAMVLELLVALCSVPGLRRQLCQTVLRAQGPRLQALAKKEGRGQWVEPDPGLALLQWASLPLDGPEACYLQALSLFAELFEEVTVSVPSGSAQAFLDLLLPVLLGLLQGPSIPLSELQLKKHCVRAARVMDLLLVLSSDDAMKMQVSQQLSSQLCVLQVELLLSSSHMDMGFSCPATSSDLSQVGAEVILKVLQLMSRLKQLVRDMETSFYRILQDQRMVTPLSLALASDHREHVQTALRILLEAAPLPDFPAVILGECIAANNAYRHREMELSMQSPPNLGRSLAPLTAHPPTSSQSIHNLIEKLQSSMELQEQVKDVRVSEIMDVYEQKICALASKEGRLQDLLEAKALALSQADRLIAQYRCQRAQAEAEARKLASLLKEAERRKEELQGELSTQMLEAERAKADIQQLLQHNTRLQAESQEHQSLKGSYNELLHRYNECERMLKELQAAHISLNKQTDTLRKQNESLKVHQDRLLTQLAEQEEQIKGLDSGLQERRAEILDLQQELKRQDEHSRERETERKDMEDTIDMLRKDLSKTELAKKDASIKASSLELQKSQLEAKLQKKEEELSKHTQMIAMIHSLSSGKLKNETVNLSL
ncbi:protein CIP2A isoform X4 [Anguilla anguilla]|uniref:protein CIP2A isoform X4 n=1 Tax=Anguilla anguilla TaxID=7936 RepID=UPI0015ABAF49|nr:protein CIP2A isoform X4 [Anguilla anguilla]